MNRKFYTYQLRVEDETLPFYIGKGKGRRAWVHLKPTEGDNSHKSNKIRKAHRDGKQVLVEFIRQEITEHQSLRLEKFYIAKYGRSDLGLGPLTNATDGGEGVSGLKISSQTRIRMSEAKVGKYLGQNNPLYGRSLPEETKLKMLAKRIKTWKITYPDGQSTIVRNLAEFCRHTGLSSARMVDVAKGKQTNHKGYLCTKLEN